jgi:hypothetical protein
MLFATSSFAADFGLFLALFGIGYVLRSAGKLAFNNPDKAVSCLKAARAFMKK